MAQKRPKRKTAIRHPAVDDAWRQAFTEATFRTNFVLTLSHSMIEYLSAVADGVQWDRWRFSNLHKPDNWLATQAALLKRGLIVKKSDAAIERIRNRARADDPDQFYEFNFYDLTQAGEAVVQLFKCTGVFVEADAAITKRLRA